MHLRRRLAGHDPSIDPVIPRIEKRLVLAELVIGYRFSDNLAVTLSYEKQLGGDTVIDMKRHMILGVRLKL